jgi:hypothetical protein
MTAPDDDRKAPSDEWKKKLGVNPKDLRVSVGRALTEEQFKEYCKQTGVRPTVVKTLK